MYAAAAAISLATREHMAPNVASPLTALESRAATAAATGRQAGRREGHRGNGSDGAMAAAAVSVEPRPVAPAAAPQIRETSGSACIITTAVSRRSEFLLQTFQTCGERCLAQGHAVRAGCLSAGGKPGASWLAS